jgi:formylglycine-generating enzyme required for sulfatase activity
MPIAFHIPLLLLAGLIALVGAGAAAAEPVRDCADCPLMVTLAPGAFTMGSSPEEIARERIDPNLVGDERPAHPVTVATAFAIGQFAVTRGEFAAFVAATGYASTGGCYLLSGDSWVFDRKRNWRDPGFAQTDQHPVVCVSHRDAQRYAQWLARKTKKPYRLPSEAEWEYAARAGTSTTRFWGDGRDEACTFANVSDFTAAEAMKWDKANKDKIFQCADGYAFTSPGGAFRPNGFGLYDMLGNVWQWADDCYHTSYAGAPKDASAWRTGDCHFRVIRGGSWSFSPRSLRAARRCAIEPEERYYNLGFRVVRAPP